LKRLNEAQQNETKVAQGTLERVVAELDVTMKGQTDWSAAWAKAVAAMQV
jgi:hypothetical protein